MSLRIDSTIGSGRYDVSKAKELLRVRPGKIGGLDAFGVVWCHLGKAIKSSVLAGSREDQCMSRMWRDPP